MSDISTTTIKVEIDEQILKTMRDKQYNLCFLRNMKVGDKVEKGNVVFASISSEELSTHMVISYQQPYGVFKTQYCIPGQGVTYGDPPSKIELGQTAFFPKHGGCEISGECSPNEPLHVMNESYDKIASCIGVTQGNLDGTARTYHPFYLLPLPAIDVRIAADLTPSQNFGILWAPRIETGIVIDGKRTDIFHFEMVGNSITLRFGEQSWITEE